MFDNNPNMASAAMAQAQSYAKDAYANQQNAVQAPMRESDAAIQRIAQQVDQLLAHSARLTAVTDRIVGSRPQAVGQAGNGANPGHMPLSAKLGILSDVLSRLAAETGESLDRLENFI